MNEHDKVTPRASWQVRNGERSFLLHDMRTGALDGWYYSITAAREMLRGIRRLYPNGEWTLLEYVHDSQNAAFGIPDHRWHMRMDGVK